MLSGIRLPDQDATAVAMLVTSYRCRAAILQLDDVSFDEATELRLLRKKVSRQGRIIRTGIEVSDIQTRLFVSDIQTRDPVYLSAARRPPSYDPIKSLPGIKRSRLASEGNRIRTQNNNELGYKTPTKSVQYLCNRREEKPG